MNEAARRRLIERHCAATIRAVATRPLAEYRNNSLFHRGRGLHFGVPHLVADAVNDSVEQNRGVADGFATRLLFSNDELHRELRPQGSIARMVFDILEQLRCESLGAKRWKGIAQNLDTAFNLWCRHSRGTGLVENEIGLLIYGVTQITRSHLTSQLQDEEVEGLIESVRFRLAPVIGDDLVLLRPALEDQAEFAEPAREIALAIEAIAHALSGDMADTHISALREKNLLPPDQEADDKYIEAEEGENEVRHRADATTGYHVFSEDFDREVAGRDLYRLEQRHQLRLKLDRLIGAQAVSIPRLAQRLKLLFAQPKISGWHEGEEEGVVDGRRLSQIVSSLHYRRVFKQEKRVPECDTVVTFLVDNSGSMKRQRYEEVTVLVDVFARALELAGIKSEILGFTTSGWAGGESIKAWRKAGCPEDPGRLNDRLHIVYKSADASWRRSRYEIAAMLNPIHYREGLDGEALQWAGQRLLNRPEMGRFLVLISDGAPMETATSNYNTPGFLDEHLRYMAAQLDRSHQIHLGAIGIALDMDDFVSQSINLDLTGTLGNRTFRCLEELFLPVCGADSRQFV